MSGTQTGGREAQSRGEDFEYWLDQQHQFATRTGLLAWYRHVSPKIRFVGKGPRARPIIVGAAVADYVAQSCRGLAVVIEAKSRKGGRLGKNEIEPQQQKHLNACADNGGIALLALEFRQDVVKTILDLPKRFVVPWNKVPWEVKRTAESVDKEALKEWEVDNRECYLKRFIYEKARSQGCQEYS